MKSKTIKQVLRKKIDEWLASIEDEALRKDAFEGVIVTGGAIASMLLKEQVNDFDVYFTNKDLAERMAKYYVARFHSEKKNGIECAIWVETTEDRVKVVVKSAGVASEAGTEKPYEYFEAKADGEASGYIGAVMRDPGDIEEVYQETEAKALNEDDDGKPKYRPIFLSTNAITLSGKIQIVLRFFGDADEIHKNYDFVHCTNYWTSADGNLTLRPDALEALLSRELKYVGSKYPVASLFRLRKFIKRNWTVNVGQILKMVMQINDLDLNSVETLQDQLTGVDCAYFAQILERVKEKGERIESAYLVEIVDRMF